MIPSCISLDDQQLDCMYLWRNIWGWFRAPCSTFFFKLMVKYLKERELSALRITYFFFLLLVHTAAALYKYILFQAVYIQLGHTNLTWQGAMNFDPSPISLAALVCNLESKIKSTHTCCHSVKSFSSLCLVYFLAINHLFYPILSMYIFIHLLNV